MSLKIQSAKRQATPVKLALQGISFSGKTMSAIKVAKGLAKGRGNGRVCVIDSENQSSSLYDFLDFDVIYLTPPFKPATYIEAIRMVVEAGYPVGVIDSGSHAWEWILAYKDELDQVKGSFNNWGKVKPLWKTLKDAILQSPIDMIVCLREKSEYAVEENANAQGGKSASVRKIGTKAVAEPDSEYEFTTVWKLGKDTHLAVVEKDRSGLWDGRSVILDEGHGAEIARWRDSGEGGGGALEAGDEWLLLAGGLSTEFLSAEADAEAKLKEKAKQIFTRLKVKQTVSVTLKEAVKNKNLDFVTLVVQAESYGATTAEALIRYVCSKAEIDPVAIIRDQMTATVDSPTSPRTPAVKKEEATDPPKPEGEKGQEEPPKTSGEPSEVKAPPSEPEKPEEPPARTRGKKDQGSLIAPDPAIVSSLKESLEADLGYEPIKRILVKAGFSVTQAIELAVSEGVTEYEKLGEWIDAKFPDQATKSA